MNTCRLNAESYRVALFSKAAELRTMLGVRQDISVESAPEEMERGLLASEREMAVGRMEGFYRLLRQVEAALARMESGEYGVCLECEEEIERKRLDALPWAILCVHCQHAAEQLEKDARVIRSGRRQAA